MLRHFLTGIAVLVLTSLSCVVAQADPLTLQDATTAAIPNLDGWNLSVELKNIQINPVANMASTPFSREGFVTGTAQLSIDGQGAALAPVTGGGLSLFAQLGCQVDLTNGVDIGGNNQLENSVGVGADNGGKVSANTVPAERFNPQIQIFLKPGMITETPLGRKGLVAKYPDQMSDDDKERSDPQELSEWSGLQHGGSLRRVMHVQESHVEVNGCGGPVSVRLHAQAQIQTGRDITAQTVNSVDVYGDIVSL